MVERCQALATKSEVNQGYDTFSKTRVAAGIMAAFTSVGVETDRNYDFLC